VKITTLLQAIGLNKTEIGIYMDLLTYGTQTISSISRTSKLHRPAIYRALPHLKEKGLISERQVGKLTHYAAEPPERLRSLLDVVHEELNTVIPQLNQLQSNKKPIVKRLDGKAGVHAVYEDILQSLKKGDEFYRYSSENSEHILTVGLPKNYTTVRDAMQLERLVISSPDYVASREPSLEESLRVVPDEFLPFSYGISQIIYGDKIAFIDYTQPIATVIENPTIAKFQKDIFMMLFRKLKR
jgi:sugar-specific transcriptional regulator TrmB